MSSGIGATSVDSRSCELLSSEGGEEWLANRPVGRGRSVEGVPSEIRACSGRGWRGIGRVIGNAGCGARIHSGAGSEVGCLNRLCSFSATVFELGQLPSSLVVSRGGRVSDNWSARLKGVGGDDGLARTIWTNGTIVILVVIGERPSGRS